jgi:hypothetical protein
VTSGTNIKKFLAQFSMGALTRAAGTVLATAFLAWWQWAAVKSFLGGIGAWLTGTIEVSRLAMFADLVVLGAFALGALWWHRSRARANEPVSAPVVPLPAPAVPANFKPTKLQFAIIFALMHRWQKQSDLKVIAEMIEDANPEVLPMLPEAHISSDLDALEAANVVRIDRLSESWAYYYLTPLGRDWMILAMKNADKARSEAK